ncbi:DUF1700 domain-containing protein [uncultured Veillonella sp.]|uniref:DUF1700 domain-containing protein n=1 Tax=uncultured Veillonella sp. TaxID=159268 RepID=UPI002626C0AA|nr:DUF1700 domain-containing protein [uncultured Veillonella sp.]
MNKEQYLDLLRYYFRQAKAEDVNEILSDYEEHFRSGYEQNLRDEEIIRSLGDPKQIYEAYLSEGIITERKGLLKGDIADDLKDMFEKAQVEFQSNMKPQLPQYWQHASKAVFWTSGTIAYILTALCWFITLIITYLLSIQWQPFVDVAPLPAISMVTIVSLFLAGFGAGLTCLFIGQECFKQYKTKKEETTKGATV